jgi:outer membrane protein assembly factor BamB
VDLDRGTVVWEAQTDDIVRATRGITPPGRRGEVERKKYTVRLQAGAGVILVSTEDGNNSSTYALSAESGDPLWSSRFGGDRFSRRLGPFIIDNAMWNLDPRRGVVIARRPDNGELLREIPAPGIRYAGHHPRCYQARATSRFIIGKERGADFVSLESGKVDWNNWVRGPCVRGVLPANGLLYSGQHSCRCYTSSALHGFLALAPQRGTSPAPAMSAADGDQRLVRGPSYESATGSEATATIDDLQWPTYRHDAERSGSTPTPVDEHLQLKWTSARLGRLSAPVVAGGRVLVAAIDQHTVYALNARSGEIDWHRTVGGRVDSPPTVVGDLALFGCRDGWVYCLRTDDGQLVWRFRAAPLGRFVGAGGQIESAWPTHGSVLVKDGVAYFVAGRSSFLDGGMYVYGLDALTGQLLFTKHLFGPWLGPEVGAAPDTPNRGFTMPGALPDILVADVDSVYLRELKFDSTLEQTVDMKPNYYKSPELTGENRGGDHKYWDNILEGFRHAAFTSPDWFHRSFFQNYPGRRLYCTTGLLDSEWHRRMYWSYGQVVGQYVAFRGSMGYAVQVFATSPREGGLNSGQGYVVYAGRTAHHERSEKLFALRPDQSEWRVRLSIRPIAMILAADRLLLAGPPDLEDPTENLAAIEGQRKAELLVLRTGDGMREATYSLESPPIYDGMASVDGRLYVCTMSGHVACLAAQ